MKRILKLIVGVCLTIGLTIAFTGCASSQQSSQSSKTPNVSFSGFEGFWEMPNKQIMYFHNNVVTYLEAGAQKMINTGIFTYTDTQFFLQINPGTYRTQSYTVVPEGVRVTAEAAAANGIWKKRDDMFTNMYDSKNPFVGYWECKTENEITILNISAFGWGDIYECDSQYKLTSRGMIEYDNNTPSQFKRTRDAGLGVTLTSQFKYILDGTDLLVGRDDDISKYDRYTKK